MSIENCLTCEFSRKADLEKYVGCLYFTFLNVNAVDVMEFSLSQADLIYKFGYANLYVKPSAIVKSKEPYIRNGFILNFVLIEKNQKCCHYKMDE
jgi:hypothetical protein